jgi:hypothetical protein
MATMTVRSVSTRTAPAGAARRATVRVETDGCVYVGHLWVGPAASRVSDVLADGRQFLSLTDVRVNDGGQSEAYLSVNKSSIRTLRVVEERPAAPQISMVPSR